jgi:hypothetical protein
LPTYEEQQPGFDRLLTGSCRFAAATESGLVNAGDQCTMALRLLASTGARRARQLVDVAAPSLGQARQVRFRRSKRRHSCIVPNARHAARIWWCAPFLRSLRTATSCLKESACTCQVTTPALAGKEGLKVTAVLYDGGEPARNQPRYPFAGLRLELQCVKISFAKRANASAGWKLPERIQRWTWTRCGYATLWYYAGCWAPPRMRWGCATG